MGVSIKELVLIQVRAEGPCSFRHIYCYVEEQFNGKVEDYLVAAALTEAIREGNVCLYDDGQSFDCCADSH